MGMGIWNPYKNSLILQGGYMAIKNTYENFVYYLSIGCETEFKYNGDLYISTTIDGKRALYNDNTGQAQYFENCGHLIESAKIDGKSLRELFDQITVVCWS